MSSSNPSHSSHRYHATRDRAHALSKAVLSKLQTHQLPPTPIHFTLIYELLTEIDPTFSKQISKALTTHTYDDQTAGYLFSALWSSIFDQKSHTEAFSEAINELIIFIEKWLHYQDDQKATLDQQLHEIHTLSSPEAILDRLKRQVLPTLEAYQDQATQFQQQVNHTNEEVQQLKQQLDKATSLAKTDELTNIPNRRGFNEIIDQATQSANHTQNTFNLLMIDIDLFKQINDEYGHLIGDSILRYLARTLHNEVKGQDSVARIGGEEFVIILPNTAYTDAIKVANNIRLKIASSPLQAKSNAKPIHLTISIGVAMYQLNEPLETLMDRADKCLYFAKNHGRNCTIGESELT